MQKITESLLNLFIYKRDDYTRFVFFDFLLILMKILCLNKKNVKQFFISTFSRKYIFSSGHRISLSISFLFAFDGRDGSRHDSPRKDVVVAVQRQLELELVARGRGRGRGRPEEVNRSNGGSGVGTITMESPIIQSSLRAGPFKPFSAPHLLLVDLETNRFSNETAAIPLSFASCLVSIAKTID